MRADGGGRRALLSVYDKTGLPELARGLLREGFGLWASGGTADALAAEGLPVEPTESITGIVSLLGGRVKTLHPELHAAILASGGEREERLRLGRPVFDLVAVDLYPFHEVAGLDPTDPRMVELVDIGGPAMARAAAKNWRHVVPALGSDVFPEVLAAVQSGDDGPDFRRRMAARVFDLTSRYDLAVSTALEGGLVPSLRYGENPHQEATLHLTHPLSGLGAAELLGSGALSYNNYLDASAAWEAVLDMPGGMPCAVILKHGNPCGAGVGGSATEAFENAFRADTVSPYGGILAMGCTVDMELVARLKGLFLEVVLAPGYDGDALARLRRRKRLRILRMPPGAPAARSVRSVWGGLLVQEPDRVTESVADGRVVTDREPTDTELRAMDLAWRVCRSVRSNAIVVGDAMGTLGVGAGQMSRIESLDLAVRRASREGHDLSGAALASDGFFPFRDGPDRAAEAGVTAIVQPGGSIRDEEVIAAADEHGMAMVMTGRRHFRH